MIASDEDICAEAERLIDLAHKSEEEHVHDALLQQAYSLLTPLVDQGVPAAQYLHACHTLSRETLDEAARDARHVVLIKQAAEAGHMKAQFALGQMYEPEAELGPDAEKSAYWLEQSALQGYPYAQWVHGLNLLLGLGVRRDTTLALNYIPAPQKVGSRRRSGS